MIEKMNAFEQNSVGTCTCVCGSCRCRCQCFNRCNNESDLYWDEVGITTADGDQMGLFGGGRIPLGLQIKNG